MLGAATWRRSPGFPREVWDFSPGVSRSHSLEAWQDVYKLPPSGKFGRGAVL